MEPCSQADRIKTLELNQEKVMDILTEVREDVKDIKKYLFEWPMEDKFVSKQTFELTVEFMKDQLAQREKEILDLKRNQNKVAWIIISAVIIAIIWLVIVPKTF